ncbi:hypothetical protein JDBV06_00840 [Mycobacterium phage dwieneke]|nr:hypothetical protein JDBV06_00840 [Mycobacterium phage dwieneke]
MTSRPPSYHYQRADELVAELEHADPRVGMSLPHVQLKFRLAELHARLANSPWWPDLEAEFEEDERLVDFNGRILRESPRRQQSAVETHIAKGEYL